MRDEIAPNLTCAERGTGLDRGEGGCSPVGPRDYGPGLVALSPLALSISVLLSGVPNRRQAGFKTAGKMGLFQGQASHFVPFCPIHFYLFGAWDICFESRSAEHGRGDLAAGGNWLERTAGGRGFSTRWMTNTPRRIAGNLHQCTDG